MLNHILKIDISASFLIGFISDGNKTRIPGTFVYNCINIVIKGKSKKIEVFCLKNGKGNPLSSSHIFENCQNLEIRFQ